jgi:phosphoribosylamine--glycine ligase
MARLEPCPDRCNVLLVGGGGREHALAWKLKQSARLDHLWLTDTSNAGLAPLGEPCPHNWDSRNVFQLQRWCERAEINLIVVGPEQPLAEGIVDALETSKCKVFGPSRAATQLEADKTFAKQVMRQGAVPTADTRVFHDVESARLYVESRDEPLVVKAAGLAAGKGAIVCDDPAEALTALEQIMVDRPFGAAGDTVLIEERLTGQEVSVLALVDGRNIWILDPCQDHKQLNEGDLGPNTGGMGAYCPTPVLDAETMAEVEREVLVPTVDALRRDGIDYRGVLYAGIMLTSAGPRVLEFNCRFGDPECQPLMARLRCDLIELLWATCTGGLDQVEIDFDERVACCVVMCSRGYPGSYEKGKPITGIDAAERSDVVVFHAGTTVDSNGALVTSGGRVLGVTALADDLTTARDLANAACDQIKFDGAQFRRDIGDRVLASMRPT